MVDGVITKFTFNQRDIATKTQNAQKVLKMNSVQQEFWGCILPQLTQLALVAAIHLSLFMSQNNTVCKLNSDG